MLLEDTVSIMTPKERAAVLRYLRRVRRALGPKGRNWIKGQMADLGGNYCLLGAVDAVRTEPTTDEYTSALILTALQPKCKTKRKARPKPKAIVQTVQKTRELEPVAS